MWRTQSTSTLKWVALLLGTATWIGCGGSDETKPTASTSSTSSTSSSAPPAPSGAPPTPGGTQVASAAPGGTPTMPMGGGAYQPSGGAPGAPAPGAPGGPPQSGPPGGPPSSAPGGPPRGAPGGPPPGSYPQSGPPPGYLTGGGAPGGPSRARRVVRQGLALRVVHRVVPHLGDPRRVVRRALRLATFLRGLLRPAVPLERHPVMFRRALVQWAAQEERHRATRLQALSLAVHLLRPFRPMLLGLSATRRPLRCLPMAAPTIQTPLHPRPAHDLAVLLAQRVPIRQRSPSPAASA